MKAQAYYNTAAEIESNICNNADELCVNCAGVVNKNYDIINKSKRNDYYLLYMAEGSMTLEIIGKKTGADGKRTSSDVIAEITDRAFAGSEKSTEGR